MTQTVRGTFRQGAPYGIIVFDFWFNGELPGCFQYLWVGEAWEGGIIGRSTVYEYDPCDEPNPTLITNQPSFDDTLSWVASKTQAYYAEDGTELCLDGNCE